jgi:hypothetical protein
VNADVPGGFQLIQGEGARSRHRTLAQSRSVAVDRSAADFRRRLALWLADVAAEAGRAASIEAAGARPRMGPR